MSSKIRYEWATTFSPRDVNEMVSLLNVVVMTTGTNGYSEPLTLKDGEELAESLEFSIKKGDAAQLMCRTLDGRVVGIASLLRPKQPDRRHVIEIARVAIHPENRGTFLRRAWREVLDRIEQMGGELIGIDVSEDGPIRLWECFGFTTWGVMKDYARVKSRKLDGYYMAVYLDEARRQLQGRRQRAPKLASEVTAAASHDPTNQG